METTLLVMGNHRFMNSQMGTEPKGMKFMRAGSSAQAKAMASKHAPDAAMLEANGQGVQLMAELKSLHPSMKIFLTGSLPEELLSGVSHDGRGYDLVDQPEKALASLEQEAKISKTTCGICLSSKSNALALYQPNPSPLAALLA